MKVKDRFDLVAIRADMRKSAFRVVVPIVSLHFPSPRIQTKVTLITHREQVPNNDLPNILIREFVIDATGLGK